MLACCEFYTLTCLRLCLLRSAALLTALSSQQTEMHVTVLYNPGTGTQANRHELDGNHDLRTVFLYWQGLLGFQDTERMIYTIAGQDDIDLSELPADTLVSSVLVKNAVISITERTQVRCAMFACVVFKLAVNYFILTCILRLALLWFTEKAIIDMS